MDLAEAEACRVAYAAMNERLASGQGVTLDERMDVTLAYEDAERWLSDQQAQARRDAMTEQGIVPGPDQSIGLGA